MTMNTIASSLSLAAILQCCHSPGQKVPMKIGPITFKHIIIITLKLLHQLVFN